MSADRFTQQRVICIAFASCCICSVRYVGFSNYALFFKSCCTLTFLSVLFPRIFRHSVLLFYSCFHLSLFFLVSLVCSFMLLCLSCFLWFLCALSSPVSRLSVYFFNYFFLFILLYLNLISFFIVCIFTHLFVSLLFNIII